jgi:hypothetical protein
MFYRQRIHIGLGASVFWRDAGARPRLNRGTAKSRILDNAFAVVSDEPRYFTERVILPTKDKAVMRHEQSFWGAWQGALTF